MCGCTSNFAESAKHFKVDRSLGLRRFSNLSDSAVEQECLLYMDEHPTAYDGNLSKCIEAKRAEHKENNLNTATNVVGYVGQAGTFLQNLSNIFGVAINQAQQGPYTGGYPPPPPLPDPEPEGLGAGAWALIGIGGIALITVIILSLRKKA